MKVLDDPKHFELDPNKTILGCCKECLANVYKEDGFGPEHPNIYECSNCGHPNCKDELYE